MLLAHGDGLVVRWQYQDLGALRRLWFPVSSLCPEGCVSFLHPAVTSFEYRGSQYLLTLACSLSPQPSPDQLPVRVCSCVC